MGGPTLIEAHVEGLVAPVPVGDHGVASEATNG
jgi:hypothetical protein